MEDPRIKELFDKVRDSFIIVEETKSTKTSDEKEIILKRIKQNSTLEICTSIEDTDELFVNECEQIIWQHYGCPAQPNFDNAKFYSCGSLEEQKKVTDFVFDATLSNLPISKELYQILKSNQNEAKNNTSQEDNKPS